MKSMDQSFYKAAMAGSRSSMAKAYAPGSELAILMKRAMPKTLGGEVDPKDWGFDHPLVKAVGRALIKAGITTSLGFNYYDLRGPAYFIFPLLTPFIQMIGRQGRVNAGVGTAAHWKATRNPNSTFIYGGVLEGQRNATATPNEIDYLATYKELGMEGGETFTAQFAGEGYTDNLADEHFRNLARLRLQEEMMTLWGNSGTAAGNLGFALGQAPNVTSTLIAGTALGNGANVVAAVVAITAYGMNPGGQAGYAAPPSVVDGITPSYSRTNADGSTTNVACGCSSISNVAAIVTTNATAQKVTVSVPAVKGAVGYAWFWGVNVTAATGNVKLGAITAWPNYTISADVKANLESAIIFSSTGNNSYMFQVSQMEQQAGILGGFVVTGYKSKYSVNPTGGDTIPIRIHPMFPQGTMLYDINKNPYPHSRIPAVRTFLMQRDYYAIEWPIVTRQWTFGTYVQEVLAHYMPWVSAIRTGCGPFVAPA